VPQRGADARPSGRTFTGIVDHLRQATIAPHLTRSVCRRTASFKRSN
jgi:hypothetical protein